ncbi:hypothetical protein D6774_01680 [Candidatus Woesearchaeota archaeon]|nr:MAG: hypothetical protein D6774_01680 [Candidatus Woesearchaeota archaeon]
MTVYEPREDSFLLERNVKKYILEGMLVLDMGTGSGIQAYAAAQQGATVLAVDVDPQVLEYHKKSELQVKLSHLFDNVEGTFDAIIFNPPYLPFDPDEPCESRLQTTGGKHGYELTLKFIEQMGDHLETHGFVLLLISSVTGKERVEAELEKHLYSFKIVDQEKIPFETLYVYKIEKNALRRELESRGVWHIQPFMHGKRGNIHVGTFKNTNVAIKSQRATTSNTIVMEAKLLKELKLKYAPRVLFIGSDYFVYDFIEGEFFPKWLEHASRREVLDALHQIYEYMYDLDRKGYNKEEMHHPTKHIIMTANNKPYLVDFERCRRSDKVHNVTQFTQYVIAIAPELEKKGISVNVDAMRKRAQEYAHKRTRKHFKQIVGGLQ